MSRRENERVDYQGTCNLATAARAGKLSQLVVVSTVGAGDSRQAISPILRLLMGPVLRMKERAEAFLRTADICYTIIRPGGLTATRRSDQVAFGEGGRLSGMITREQVARVCVDALETPAMRNRVLEVVDAATVKPARRDCIIEL